VSATSFARILGAAIFCASASVAAQDVFRIVAEQIPGFLAPGIAGVVVADFDRDGRDEVAFTGLQSSDRYYTGDDASQSGIVIIVRYDAANASYGLAQTLISDMPRLVGLARDGAATPGLVAVSRDGIVAHYVGWPLTMVSHVSLGRPVETMRVGDVDGDGRAEVVVADSANGMAAYDLETGALKKSYDGRFASSIELAQLDADPALEIILAGTPGLIVDGATNATDWQDAGGFGPLLAAGHILADQGDGFIAAQDWDYLSGYRGQPYSPIWSVKSQFSNGVDTADIDGDGIDEILYSGYYGGFFAVIDALTQAVRMQAPYAPIRHMGAARMQGTSAWQFAFGETLNSSGGDTAEIISEQGDSEFALHEESAPFSVTGTDDVDGDGAADAVWISAYSDARYDGGKIHVYDPATGAERWQSHLLIGGVELLYQSLSAAAVARLRPLGPADIVVADVGLFTGAEIRIVDGSTRQVTLSNTDTGLDRTIDHLAIVDGSDGPQILATANGSAIGVGLYDGSDLHTLWTETLDASFGEGINDLQPLTGDAGSQVFLLAAPDALVAYDIGARGVAWSRPGPVASAAVLHLSDGTPVIGALGATGRLQLLTIDGMTTLADFSIGESEPGAVREIAGAPGKAVACIDRRIVELDLDAQTIAAQSPWIGGLACAIGNLVLSAAQGGKTHIRLGSLAGVFDLDLAGPQIFSDGFDGSVGR
jgi:hypothetical protein